MSGSRDMAMSGGRVWALLNTPVFTLSGPKRVRTVPADVIAAAALPEAVGGRIAQIVRKTRLWNDERVEVARELCSHAAEAAAAGKTEAEVVAALGEPRVVSPLLRRAVVRKRPWLWHARVWTLRAAAGTVLAGGLFAGGLAARLYMSDPDPKRNFYAELNEPLERYGEEDRAWPLVKEAWAMYAPLRAAATEAMSERARQAETPAYGTPQDQNPTRAGVDLLASISPEHPDFEAMLAFRAEAQPALEIARRAAAKPILGRLLSARQEEFPHGYKQGHNLAGWLPEPLPMPDDPAEQEWIIGALLPSLAAVRGLSQGLSFDAWVRAGEGDSAGAVASLEAILGFAEQQDGDRFLIGHLVGVAIEQLAIEAVGEILVDHREGLTDADLQRLAHTLARPRLERLPIETERMMFDDFLQRAYTDDGHGDGVFTDEGVVLLSMIYEWNGEKTDRGLFARAWDATVVARIGSRAEQAAMADEYYTQLRLEEEAGYEVYRSPTIRSDEMIEGIDPYRYLPLYRLLPSTNKALAWQLIRRARLDAAMTAIAAELFRRDTGAWPADVADLVPTYMPRLPEDPVTGEPMRLVIRDGAPMVYSVGQDGDDDGGEAHGRDESEYRPGLWEIGEERPVAEPKDGDWIVFP